MKNFHSFSRVFFKYLISYMIILLIPSLIMGILVYNYFMNILEEEILNRNLDAMIKVNHIVEQQMEELKKIPLQLYGNEEFLPYSIKHNPTNIIDIKKILFDYDITNDFIHEICFYFRNDSYIYSSISSYTLPSFIGFVYNYAHWNFSSFNEDINSISRPTLRLAEDVTVLKNEKKRFITYMYPFPSNSAKPYGTIIFLIDEDSLKYLIRNNLGKDEANTVILDHEGGIVTSLWHDDYLESTEFKSLISKIRNTGTRIIEIGNSKYCLSYVRSGNTGWTYVTLVPSEVILKKVSDVRTKFLLGTVMIILLGGMAIYFLMAVNYNPIKKLKIFAEESWRHIPMENNEINVIKLALTHLTVNGKVLAGKMRNSREALKEFLLLDFLKGNIKNIRDFNNRGRDIGICFTKPDYRVVVISLDGNTSLTGNQENEIIKRIEDKFPDEIEGYGKGSIEANKILFIMAHDTISDSMLKIQLLFIQQYLNEKWKIKSTIGVGKRYGLINQVGKSYIEASTSIDYRLVKGKNKVIFFDEVMARAVRLEYYPLKELEELELSVLQGNIDKIEEIIIKLIRIIKEDNTPLFVARCLCFDIINTAIKTTYLIYKGFAKCKSEYPDTILLMEFHTVEEVAEAVRRICFDICSYIREDKTGSHESMMKRIYGYIHANYQDYSFSVQNMADDFGMSISNLSHYFKVQAGQTLSQYINRLKIEKAKELLRSENASLKNVVEQIGYSDVSSFIKKFKQLVGQTPGEYRKLYQNQ